MILLFKGELVMNQYGRTAMSALAIVFTFLGLGIVFHSEAQAQQMPRINDRKVEQIIRSIENRSDTFRRSFAAALDRSRLDGTYTEASANEFVKNFEQATNDLRSRFNGRIAVATDVDNILNSAAVIDQFLRTNLRQNRVQRDWTLLRVDLQRLATAYNVALNFDGRVQSPRVVTPTTAYRVSDAQVESLLRRIETKSDTFHRSLDRALDNGRLNNTVREDNISGFVADFENSTDELRRKFNARISIGLDVTNVLVRAARIDDLMLRTLRRQNVAQRDWRALRTDLNLLANYYNLAFNLDNRRGMPAYSAIAWTGTGAGSDAPFVGTYRLNTGQSQNARTVAENAARNVNRNNRQRIISNLVNRLSSPELLAVERRATQLMLASSFSPQITLVADGIEHIETYPNGRPSRVRTTLAGDTLTIVSNGDRANDFSAVFKSLDGGRRMMVTREVFLEGSNQAVQVRSYYDRTSEIAQFNIFNNRGNTSANYDNDFLVPSNTVLVAKSTSMLSTRTSRDGDRFTMIVQSPSQYAGAVIEGFVSNPNRSGRIAGRSEMNLNFETIRMPNNRTYRFAGITQNVRVGSGRDVRVDNENTIEGNSQNKRTFERTAVGAGVGALLGALLGGGDGAAIGAAVGAGTGVGSVYLQGPYDLELGSGTEFTIRATAPIRN
jgi:regulator of protease activity HflC (stomatin/prohibitin superfamily)